MPLPFAVAYAASARRVVTRVLSCLLLLVFASVYAHEGHDHAEPAPAPSGGPLLARATAQSDLFELVLEQLPNQQFQIYLDQFATNTPVANARIELESGAIKASVSTNAQGMATLSLPALAQAGVHPLVFTISAGSQSDLLETTLTLTPPPALATPGSTPASLSGWWSLLAVLLAGPLGFWLGKRRARQ